MPPPGSFTIFVSSTSEVLAPLRKEVVSRLEARGYLASSLDLEGYSGGKILDLVEESLKRADAVVILVGFAKGTNFTFRESWAQYEYRRAIELGTPLFVYLLEEAVLKELGSNPAHALNRSQTKFRKKIEAGVYLYHQVKSLTGLRDAIDKADYGRDAARWHAARLQANPPQRSSRAVVTALGSAIVSVAVVGAWLHLSLSLPILERSEKVPKQEVHESTPIPTPNETPLAKSEKRPIRIDSFDLSSLTSSATPKVQRDKIPSKKYKLLIVPKEPGRDIETIYAESEVFFGEKSPSVFLSQRGYHVFLEGAGRQPYGEGYQVVPCIRDISYQDMPQIRKEIDDLRNDPFESKYELRETMSER